LLGQVCKGGVIEIGILLQSLRQISDRSSRNVVFSEGYGLSSRKYGTKWRVLSNVRVVMELYEVWHSLRRGVFEVVGRGFRASKTQVLYWCS